MALTDGFLAICLAIGVLYYLMYMSKIRWVRMTGCFAIMIVAIGAGTVEDTIPMYIFAFVNIMVCGIQLMDDVGSLGEVFNK